MAKRKRRDRDGDGTEAQRVYSHPVVKLDSGVTLTVAQTTSPDLLRFCQQLDQFSFERPYSDVFWELIRQGTHEDMVRLRVPCVIERDDPQSGEYRLLLGGYFVYQLRNPDGSDPGFIRLQRFVTVPYYRELGIAGYMLGLIEQLADREEKPIKCLIPSGPRPRLWLPAQKLLAGRGWTGTQAPDDFYEFVYRPGTGQYAIANREITSPSSVLEMEFGLTM